MVPAYTDSATPAAAAGAAPEAPPHTEVPGLGGCVRGANIWMMPHRAYQLTAIRTNRGGPPDLYAGLFTDPGAAGHYVRDAGLAGADAYLTINSPRPRAGRVLPVNDVTSASRGACVGNADFDVVEKILVDLDTVRPKKTAATDAERAAGVERAQEVRGYLAGIGFAPPVMQATPNGAALLYRVNLPASIAPTVSRFLGSLAAKFDDDRVEVDRVVFNPARLGRPAGSVGHKGVASADRPHRVCELLCPGDPAAFTPRNLVERVAAEAPARPRGRGGSGGVAGPARGGGLRMTRDGLELFLAEHLFEFDLDGPHPLADGRIWRFEVCPFHEGHDRLGDAAVLQRADGWVQFKCFHDGCAGRGFRDLIELVADDDADDDGTPPCIAAARARARRRGPRTCR